MLLHENDDEITITRFYFDNGNLVFIKNKILNEEELLKVDIRYDSDDSLFEIPEEYAEL